MDAVNCSKCGAERPAELTTGSARPPCPICGAVGLRIRVAISETVRITDHALTALVPGNQTRDWEQRWKLIQQELSSILSPPAEPMSGVSIHAELQKLCSFYVLAYHLKDALKHAGPSIGLKALDVERAITTDRRLALIADLANLDKHMMLTRPPRSGTSPIISKVSGVDDPTQGGWRLRVEIVHGNQTLDGVSVAEDAVSSWREKLTAWQLI